MLSVLFLISYFTGTISDFLDLKALGVLHPGKNWFKTEGAWRRFCLWLAENSNSWIEPRWSNLKSTFYPLDGG